MNPLFIERDLAPRAFKIVTSYNLLRRLMKGVLNFLHVDFGDDVKGGHGGTVYMIPT